MTTRKRNVRQPTTEELAARNAVEVVTEYWEGAAEIERLRLVQRLTVYAALDDPALVLQRLGKPVRKGR